MLSHSSPRESSMLISASDGMFMLDSIIEVEMLMSAETGSTWTHEHKWVYVAWAIMSDRKINCQKFSECAVPLVRTGGQTLWPWGFFLGGRKRTWGGSYLFPSPTTPPPIVSPLSVHQLQGCWPEYTGSSWL